MSCKAKKKQHAWCIFWLIQPELFTQMAGLKFENAVTQPPQQYYLLNYRPSML